MDFFVEFLCSVNVIKSFFGALEEPFPHTSIMRSFGLVEIPDKAFMSEQTGCMAFSVHEISSLADPTIVVP